MKDSLRTLQGTAEYCAIFKCDTWAAFERAGNYLWLHKSFGKFFSLRRYKKYFSPLLAYSWPFVQTSPRGGIKASVVVVFSCKLNGVLRGKRPFVRWLRIIHKVLACYRGKQGPGEQNVKIHKRNEIWKEEKCAPRTCEIVVRKLKWIILPESICLHKRQSDSELSCEPIKKFQFDSKKVGNKTGFPISWR